MKKLQSLHFSYPFRSIVLCLSCTLPLMSCTPPATKANDIDTPPAKSTVLQVRTVDAKQGKLSAQRSTGGTVTAIRDSQISPRTGGVVQQVFVEEGDLVSAGQVLVKLDDTAQRQALENAQLQVEQARLSLQQLSQNTQQRDATLQSAVRATRAALKTAQQQLNSAEKVYAIGGISLADLENARAQQAQAMSNLTQAQNNLQQNGRSAQSSIPLQEVQLQSAQTALKQAKENLSRTEIKAPFVGVVAKLSAKVGEFATQGNTLMRLVDPQSIRVEFTVPANDAANLPVRKEVRVRYAGERYKARIAENAGIAAQNRLVTMTARLIEPAMLPVGGATRVTYRRILGEGTLIPVESVQSIDGTNAVYIVEDDIARRQEVQVQAEVDDVMVVRGLKAGLQVVSPAPASLQDGMKISVGQAEPEQAAPTGSTGSTAKPSGQQGADQ